MLRHYVLFQFEEGFLTPERVAYSEDTFRKIVEAMDCVHAACVHVNCLERDVNADLMVLLDVDDADGVAAYLAHPLHVAYAREMMPHIRARMSFDHILAD